MLGQHWSVPGGKGEEGVVTNCMSVFTLARDEQINTPLIKNVSHYRGRCGAVRHSCIHIYCARTAA